MNKYFKLFNIFNGTRRRLNRKIHYINLRDHPEACHWGGGVIDGIVFPIEKDRIKDIRVSEDLVLEVEFIDEE